MHALSQGAGVLDVAGGRGDVSFELHTVRGVCATLVEPRARKLSKAQHRWLAANCGVRRRKVDEAAVKAGTMKDPLAPFLCTQIQAKFPFVANEADTVGVRTKDRLMADCSAVVGLHPDQATEAIVDFAVKQRKPFAVVPCCVFASGTRANASTKRRIARGEAEARSMSFEAWLDYLQAKHPAVKRSFLPFEGKNCVLWCRDYAETSTKASSQDASAVAV
jgi:hypothetical protein